MRILALIALLSTAPLIGAVVELRVVETTPVLQGQAFDSAGSYERVTGTVRFAVDPEHPNNSRIIDIRLAPRNVQRLVEFTADFMMLRPADLTKGNGTVLFEVPNRGRPGMLGTFNRGRSGTAPARPEEFGDGYLLKAGYTLVWLGWQHDLAASGGVLRLHAPTAAGVRGLVRTEYTASKAVTEFSLTDAGHVPYVPVAGGKIAVTVREGLNGARRTLSNDQWTLDGTKVRLSSPTAPGSVYEVVYESSDPPVAGLGLAAIRDLVSHLKRDHKFAIGFGVSQSAMVLRTFLLDGFNQDENGKIVFDGIFAHVAGARRSAFHRFALPSRTAGPLRNASLSPTEQGPYTDTDLLAEARRGNVVPKIFHTNSAYEYWGSGASLAHTTADGKRDVELPSTSRMYVFAGGQHGPAGFPPQAGTGQNLPNFNDYNWPLRSLLQRLHAWVVSGAEPPASAYPTIAAGTLVPLAKYKFPALPGVKTPTVIHTPGDLDFGPDFKKSGLVAKEPPTVRRSYTTLIPQADVDGNDASGIRMPEVECAIGAFTGWNLRSPSIGAESYLLGSTGSYIPFPRTSAEQQELADPRRAILDRFRNEAEHTACVERIAQALVKRGLLLQSDVAGLTRGASRHWAWRMSQPSVITSGKPTR